MRNSGFGSSEIIKYAIFNIVTAVQGFIGPRIVGGENAKIQDFPYMVSEFLLIINILGYYCHYTSIIIYIFMTSLLDILINMIIQLLFHLTMKMSEIIPFFYFFHPSPYD